MSKVKGYHRPETVDEALRLLGRAGVATAVLAGGTSLVAAQTGDVEEVVDLQAVGLADVAHTPDQMSVGAMVRLQTLVEDPDAPVLLRQMAQQEGPNTFRNAATIGGVVAGGDGESELLAALLVLEATVTIQTLVATHSLPLADFLANRGDALAEGIITAVSLSKIAHTAHARVARTPQDRPIVAAVAARTGNDEVRLALCGVAETAVLAHPAHLDTLTPPADFRGSAAYRQQMAVVLTRRVLNELA